MTVRRDNTSCDLAPTVAPTLRSSLRSLEGRFCAAACFPNRRWQGPTLANTKTGHHASQWPDGISPDLPQPHTSDKLSWCRLAPAAQAALDACRAHRLEQLGRPADLAPRLPRQPGLLVHARPACPAPRELAAVVAVVAAVGCCVCPACVGVVSLACRPPAVFDCFADFGEFGFVLWIEVVEDSFNKRILQQSTARVLNIPVLF